MGQELRVFYMKTYVPLQSYLPHFLWREIFQTRVVEKIKTHILCLITSSRKLFRLCDNVEKYGEPDRP